MRNARKKIVIMRAVYGVFGLIPPMAMKFKTPDDPAAGGGSGGSGGGAPAAVIDSDNDPQAEPPAIPPARKPELVPKNQLVQAIKRREKAVAISRLITEKFGVDPDDFEIEGDGTDVDPFRITNLDALLTEAGQAPGKSGKAKATPSEIRQANRQRDNAVRENGALKDFIAKNYVAAEIKSAAAKLGAVDADRGQYRTIVKLIRPMFTPTVNFDSEANSVSVALVCKDDETGEELTTPEGDPLPIEGAVQRLLTSDKSLKASQARGGPGAGGAAIGNNGLPQQRVGSSQETNDPDKVTQTAVNGFFGGPPSVL